MKSIGIMQPYFFPYLGYYQLMNTVDEFVVYDEIQFTKKGWIHRNRLLSNQQPKYFSLSVAKDSDYLNVNERRLADAFSRQKLLAQIKGAYGKAPMKKAVFPLLEEILMNPADNLFDYIFNSLRKSAEYLGIETPLVISSDVDADHSLAGKDRVISIVKASEGTTYLNPSGGVDLYQAEEFQNHGIKLQFLFPELLPYPQLTGEFVPGLSILDVMMFNTVEEIQQKLLSSFAIR